MEVTDSVVVQSSKLSPHVKPFVPRTMQSDYQGPQAPPYLPNYAIIPGCHPDHPSAYFPFISGLYPVQDYHAGYGLYPYPVYMVEEMTPSGSYVSPGTFVCPRGSLQPQRRQLPKSKVPNGYRTFSAMEAKDPEVFHTKYPAPTKKEADSFMPNSCVENELWERQRTDIKNSKEQYQERNAASVNGESKPAPYVSARSNDPQKNWKQRKPKPLFETTKDTAANMTSKEKNVNSKTASPQREKFQPTHKETYANRVNAAPASKSFADIMKRSTSQSSNGNWKESPPGSSSPVERHKDPDIGESFRYSVNHSKVNPSVVKRDQPPLLKMPAAQGHDRTSNRGVRGDRQRFDQVGPSPGGQSRCKTDCRPNGVSESDATAHIPGALWRKNPRKDNRSFESSRSHSFEKSEDATKPFLPVDAGSKENDDVSDSESTWMEVRSSRRAKDARHVRKQSGHSTLLCETLPEGQKAKEQWNHDEVHPEGQRAKEQRNHIEAQPEKPMVKEQTPELPSHTHSKEGSTKSKGQQERVSKSAINLCNPKDIKNTENLLARSQSARLSEGNAKSDVLEQSASDGINAGTAAKKKRKTAGQLKKEYQNKVKSLPAVQCKVNTVTQELYDKVKPISSPLSSGTDNNSLPGKRFGVKEFPALGTGRQRARGSEGEMRLRSAAAGLGVNSDDSWSDVEGAEGKGRKKKTASPAVFEDFPALESLIDPLVSTSNSYSSLLKKNFWSLPPRITPIENVSNTCTNSASLLEKLLAESTRQSVSVPNSQARNVCGKLNFADSVPSDDVAHISLPISEPNKVKPKSKGLIEISVASLIAKKQKKCPRSHVKLPMSSKMARRKGNVHRNYRYVANILDSTAPRRRYRGKQREFPRKRGPSALKKVILKERIAKRLIRAATEMKQCSKDNLTDNDALQDGVVQQDGDIDDSCALPASCDTLETAAKRSMHNRNFREYCNHLLSPDIDSTAKQLLQDLVHFHDELYKTNRLKAMRKRRMVVGFHEVCKHLRLKHLKCIILAPNLEKIKSSGGLDDLMNFVIRTADEQKVPYAFALGRRNLGKICYKKCPVSCIGIFSYKGSDTNFENLCQLTAMARQAYREKLDEVMKRFSGELLPTNS